MSYLKSWLFVVFLALSIGAFAGTVKGKITDSKTGEPLIGATVTLVGNGKKLTTSVNLDGSYTFRNVPTGSYKLKVNFGGYKVAETENVVVKSATDVVVVAEEMKEDVADLGEVKVNSYKNKESETFAISLEKNSDVVTNVMSAKSIELSPDVTVANSLQRISSISFQPSSKGGESQFVIIRGMDQRYNTTLVNGIQIPSPNDQLRSVPMNIFLPEVLQRLEVIKELTPNMEGNAIGGVMNLVMKDAPNKEEFKIFGAGGGNTTFFNQNYYGFPHSSINFKSPKELTGLATDSSFSSKALKLNARTQPLDIQTGFTYGNRYFKKRLGFVLSTSYQSLYAGTNESISTQIGATAFKNPDGSVTSNYPFFDQVYKNYIYTQNRRISINNKFDYIINNRNKISLYNLYVRMDQFQVRELNDTDINAHVGAMTITRRTSWTEQSIYNSTLHGEHELTPRTSLNWSASYSFAKQQIPDLKNVSYTNTVNRGTGVFVNQPDSGTLGGVSHSWAHNSDQDVAAYLNLILKRKIAHRDVQFDFGGMFRDKTRDNFYIAYSVSPINTGVVNITELDTFTNHLSTNQQKNSPAGNPGTARNFSIREDVAAGYAQFKFMATPKLQVLGGVRVENTNQNYSTDLSTGFDQKNGHIYYYDILPSLHFKYTISSTQAVRASYYRSFVRPSFGEIIPSYVSANETTTVYDQQGNPYLKHTTADNYDARYELFPKKGADELLVGIFVKQLYNPIEVTFDHYNLLSGKFSPSTNILTPLNVGNVTNAGFEFTGTKYFGMFGISANYTYTHSATTTTKYFVTYDIKNQLVLPPAAVNQTRPLQGQAQNIANVSLLFKDHKIGLDMQLGYNYTGERIAQVSSYYNMDTWQAPQNVLHFSFTKKIVKKFEVYGKVINITNEKNKFYLKAPYVANPIVNIDYLQDNTKHIFNQSDIYKASYWLGVRFHF